MKIGRNDPCPCGSGKKYKQCCLKGENISNITGPQSGALVDDFLESVGASSLDEYDEKMQGYEKYIEQNSFGTNPPKSLMEYLGRPNLATKSINDMHQILDGHDFSSPAEEEFFMNNYTTQRNNRGIKDFLGISPLQMMRITEDEIEDIEDVVRLNENITNKEIASVPIIQFLEYLLSLYAANNYTLELTAKGNYRPSLVKQFHKHFFSDDPYLCNIDREDYSKGLSIAHTILLDLEYIVERTNSSSGKSRLNDDGIALLTENNLSALYLEILGYFLYDLDWVEQIRIDEIRFEAFSFIQDSAVFSLFLLKKLAAKFITEETLYAAFTKAFPDFDPFLDSEEPIALFPMIYDVLFIH